ncbi:MAG: GGDEF domain-containing protein [Dehalococcoidia bacterium]|nr:GGDEF domain-containing protein [Dehalococcoidia bacterium]
MDERWVLVDPNTGLHVAWYFWLRVLDEANRAARYGIPFGLFLLEAESEGERASDRLLEEAMAAVPAVIRSTDLGGAIGAGRVGIVLPHQDEAAVEQARTRILAKMEARRAPGVRWNARMLAYPRDAAEISNLLTFGWRGGRGAEPRRRASERIA